jgi:hypothetical protein
LELLRNSGVPVFESVVAAMSLLFHFLMLE